MNDTGVIDQFLTVFTQYIDSGFGLLGGEVGFLSTTLIVIDVTIAALFWAWGTDEDVLQRLIKKTLYIGTFAFIIGNFSNLAGIMLQSFAGLGLQASGSGMAIGDFMRPGVVAATGLDAGQPLLDATADLVGPVGLFTNFVQILISVSYTHLDVYKRQVSTRTQRVRVPETPVYLDALLADEPLTGGLEPMLGTHHLRTLTITGFPTATFPGLLDDCLLYTSRCV